MCSEDGSFQVSQHFHYGRKRLRALCHFVTQNHRHLVASKDSRNSVGLGTTQVHNGCVVSIHIQQFRNLKTRRNLPNGAAMRGNISRHGSVLGRSQAVYFGNNKKVLPYVFFDFTSCSEIAPLFPNEAVPSQRMASSPFVYQIAAMWLQ